MNYLLDTHVLLWSLFETDKISPKIIQIIENQQNNIFVSAISFWEISLKFSLGKLEFKNIDPSNLNIIILEMDFKIIDLKAEEATSYHSLIGKWHKDPFDRMLIIQAIRNNFILITKDEDILKYKNEGLKTLW